jgi:hypothetical protein
MAFARGTKLGPYEIAPLGAGGMGSVEGAGHTPNLKLTADS